MIDGRDLKRDAGEEWTACSGVVLAGGASGLLGREGARAASVESPVIFHVIETLQTLFQDVFVVADKVVPFERFDVPVVSAIVGEAGCLGGLLTALVYAKASRCFVAACDMPSLNAALIRRMLAGCEGYDAVVPELRGELQPFHAFYSKRCSGHIQDGLAEGKSRIADLYPKVLTRYLREDFWEDLDPESRSFVTIRTPEDLPGHGAGP